MQFTELSTEELAELEAGKRTSYAREALDEFKSAGIHAADVTDAFPGRKTSNVANALKRLTARQEYAGIKVIHVSGDNERLALVNESA